MKEETLEYLVEQRRGYKYLNKDGLSPYQNYKYDLKCRKQMMTELNEDPDEDCGEGWNLATLKWIADNCLRLNGVIIECEIPRGASRPLHRRGSWPDNFRQSLPEESTEKETEGKSIMMSK